jgi:copper chaperone CopZ
MTCNGCVARVKSELLKLGAVTEADVQLTAPQATVRMQEHIPVSVLQSAISKAGTFTITEAAHSMHNMEPAEEKTWLATYKPLLLIGAFITGITFCWKLPPVPSMRKEGCRTSWPGSFWCFLFSSSWTLKALQKAMPRTTWWRSAGRAGVLYIPLLNWA